MTMNSEPQASLLDQPLLAAAHWTWEKTAYLVLIAAGFITRFYDLGARVMSHDESLHTQFAWYLYQGRGFQHSPLMHGPLRFEVTAFMYWIFGDNDFTARIVPALMGVLAIGLMYFFRRWLGRAGALAAAGLMLISPYMLYYSRYIRDEPFVIVWGMLLALCVLNYMETRAPKYLYGLAAVMALFYATMETSFIYIAISMLFLGLHLVRELLAVTWPRPEFRPAFNVAFAAALVAVLVAAALLVYGQRAGTPTGMETDVPADPATAAIITAASPLVGAAAVVGVLAGLAMLAAVYFVYRAFGEEIRRFPALDLLIVFGVFVLPQLTAFPVRALGRNPIEYNLPPMDGLGFGQAIGVFFKSDPGITLTVAILLGLVSLAIGWWWNLRVFAICAGIFFGLYIPLFTTFFTNGGGLATGLIGSLGYWLEQHGVHRGGQPWYYYPVINLTLYEFLPTLGALAAAVLGVARWVRQQRSSDRQPISPADTLGFPVLVYFAFWAVLALVGFSIAGEKMPWLTTHISLPLIWLSGWAIGQLLVSVDWPAVRARGGWVVLGVLPLFLTAAAALLGFGPGGLFGAQGPFRGAGLAELQATSGFISALAVVLITGAALYWQGRQLDWRLVTRLLLVWVLAGLALLTARTAFVAAYINYDSANEFLVYAHGARGVKTVMAQIDEISARMKDGQGLKVAYDSDVAWPMTWYLRNYDKNNYGFYGDTPTREGLDAQVVIAGPKDWSKVEALLGDRYYQFEYIRMVWPMQDYFNLTWDRVRTALSNPDYRQALWNIWYNRDYKRYGELTKVNFDLSQWPVAERMRFYVRKDIAAQIWAYGVGPTQLGAGAAPEDPYKNGRQVFAASAVWGSAGAGAGQLDGPRGLAVGRDGSIYVADTRNHRIQKFDPQGGLLKTWGKFGALDQNTGVNGTFNEPWGVAVGPDGSVYVADTWNHRVQKFDADGNFLTTWGKFGQAETLDAFWGPRAVAVGPDGRVFVADTGNKRVVVFDANGTPLTSIGQAGFEQGQLDEPVGVAVDADGQVYVADTWNQRVQVFRLDPATGEYLFAREWAINGWFGQSLENKPYLALDAQGRVYITDPEGYRVLVFNPAGEFVTTWGDFGTDSTTFGLAAGIAVDAAGNIYVSDSANQRLLKFLPLP